MAQESGNHVEDSLLMNYEFVEQLYDQFCKDPHGVESSWGDLFKTFEHSKQVEPQAIPKAACSIHSLIEAYRTFGHLKAKTNPLHNNPEDEPWQLKLERFGFTEKDLGQLFPTMGFLQKEEAPLYDIIAALESIYCSTVGVEYMKIAQPEIKKWLQEQIEPAGFKKRLTIDQKKNILDHLNKSELFEIFLHTKYPGQKRFSLEGGETFIPMLAAAIDQGAQEGVEEFLIGMAHRGRLNVLSNILNKSYSLIFSEFDENYIPESFEQSGDVKYHKGFFSQTFTEHGHKVEIRLTPNPSHLEAVDSVIEGQVYAKQIQQGKKRVLPILVHGDAALAGQGIVYETLQMKNLEGYGTGGTLHFVINNQIGFTTLPRDGRSTLYCTDIAHTFNAPVFHVNAEDPEGCVYAAYLALELRQKFECDVFLDLLCYRKYGHNEGDEPAYTQPHEYAIIRSKKSIREIYRDDLIQQGIVERAMSEELENQFKNALQEELKVIKQAPKVPSVGLSAETKTYKEALFGHIQTGVSLSLLKQIGEAICRVPEGFTLHPKLIRLFEDRLSMVKGNANSKPLDWGMAEALAIGSLLWDGVNVRLSGQDSCRGTFSHRHSMWMDQKEEKPYYPLKHLKASQGLFQVYNSHLSEYAVVGFEYGYSIASPETLVMWEAQFGDFCNGAQVIIDQFITTGEQKWGQQSSLTLLLPHGYEGQGPEHSSARMERFLTLVGQNNIQVVNPSTPAQFFHLLRRQQLSNDKKPLVVFTPKALLRHPECVSSVEELTKGSFQEILDDPKSFDQMEHLVLCSGHIYYDLLAEREKRQHEGVAIVRIEQLYPFHQKRMKEIFNKYRECRQIDWVQEEPRNMGAANFIKDVLASILPEESSFNIIARPKSSSPAVGSHMVHKNQLMEILNAVFGQKQPSIFEIAGKK